ncbi:MAG: hypothetical protein DHS20C20_15090 [Ardenticatenaceae bacterium]|nr:MAG: hypothetical protein DHS20C20_15090 [Ardenticatenaceae bacterium]
MKRFLWILFLAATVWFTAVSCTAAVEEEMPPPEPVDGGALNEVDSTDRESILDERLDAEAEPDVFPRATLTPPSIGDPIEPDSAPEEGYPALPSPTPYPEGYEFPPTVPALNPYPEANGTFIWIIKPVGEQCAESPATPDLQTAVADMVAFGILVEAAEMTELAVCSACGCPTSAHFRLQIDAGYLGNAEALGWVAEQ